MLTVSTTGYDSMDRLQTGPLAEGDAMESAVLNASARRIVEHIQQNQPVEVGSVSRWMADEFSIPAEQAENDIQIFAMNAVDQGFLSVRAPTQWWSRIIGGLRALPSTMRSLLVGSKLWSEVPRKHHSPPRYTSFLAVVMTTATPYVAAPAAVLGALCTWFVMAEGVFSSFRSVFLLALFFCAMFVTGVVSHLVHESTHYLTARRRGSQILTVYRGGGSVGMTRHTSDPASEIMITVVGPLAGIATAVTSAVLLALLLDTHALPVSLSRLEYTVAIILGLVPAVGQLGNFFPGTADGNVLLNSTMALIKGQQ